MHGEAGGGWARDKDYVEDDILVYRYESWDIPGQSVAILDHPLCKPCPRSYMYACTCTCTCMHAVQPPQKELPL